MAGRLPDGDLPFMDDWWLPNPPYGYVPTKSACVVFVTVFTVSTLLHMVSAWRYRMWWLLPTVCLTCVMELAGWSVRAWSSSSFLTAQSVVAFWVQWAILFIAPNFMIAALFMIFSQITRGPALSRFRRIRPERNSTIFLAFGGIALFAQIPGVVMTAVLSADEDGPDSVGQPLALSGVGLLIAMIFVFICLITEFTIRLCLNKPLSSEPREVVDGRTEDKKSKYMLFALIFCSLLLLTRCAWRLTQLLGDFVDPLNTVELYTCVLDGGMVAAAVLCLNIFHPGHLQIFEENKTVPVPRLFVALPRDTIYIDNTSNIYITGPPDRVTSSLLAAVGSPPGYDKKSDRDSDVAESDIATVV